jgi:hypothetical protein
MMATRTLTGLMFVAAFAGGVAGIESADPAPLCTMDSTHFPAGAQAGMPGASLFLTLPTARPLGANPADAARAHPRILRITR